jgi:5-(carboxyamino)imidazole ribonucleotide mutase
MIEEKPLVAIVMGSDSDIPTMKQAAEVCKEFGVRYSIRVVSAHRTPLDMTNFGQNAQNMGYKVIIAGAGGAAHLPGMIAANTTLPVIGVPIQSKALNGLDSLLSIVQMPPGVPVATVAIGAGKNAGLLAIQILSLSDKDLEKKFLEYKLKIAQESRDKNNNEEFSVL